MIPEKQTTYSPSSVGLLMFEDKSGSILGTLPSGEQVKINLPPLGVAILKMQFADAEVEPALAAEVERLVREAAAAASGIVTPDLVVPGR